jgi:hypothetical protein
MGISLDELDRKIADAIQRQPGLRKVQLQARVNFAVAQALQELVEMRGETDAAVANKAQIDPEYLQSLCQGNPVKDVTLLQLAAIGSAIGYQFFFQFVPRSPHGIVALDDSRSAEERRVSAIKGQDVVPALWSVNDEGA